MSIQSEIDRISTNVANTLSAIESKGVTVSDGANSDDMAALVNEIEQGGAVESVDGVLPDENGNVPLGAAKLSNYITEMTSSDFEALTAEERAALYASGVRILSVEKASGEKTTAEMQQIAEFLYPVGIVVELATETNPATLWGIGTWESYLPGRVLVGAGTADSGTVYGAGDVGGEEQHTLTVEEMPSHKHDGYVDFKNVGYSKDLGMGEWSSVLAHIGFDQSGTGRVTTYTGNSQPHNIMQPYGVVYRWLRVA